MRAISWVFLAGASLALVAAGCDGETPATDAGPSTGSDGGGGSDGGTGTDAGGDGSDAGPGDAGPGDAGPPYEPTCDNDLGGGVTGGRIRIEDSCPDFTACGGDPTGTWCYADICVKKNDLLEPVLAEARMDSTIGGFITDCDVDDITLISSTGTAVGSYTVTETSTGTGDFSRMLATSADAVLQLGPDCVAINCAATGIAVNAALNPPGGDSLGSASCSGSPCMCDVTFDNAINETGTYEISVSGTQITTNGGSRTFDYCVEGGGVRFQEVGDPLEVEPGLHTVLGTTP